MDWGNPRDAERDASSSSSRSGIVQTYVGLCKPHEVLPFVIILAPVLVPVLVPVLTRAE